MAIIARLTRSSMIEVLSQDYIRTAKAKGLSPYKIVFKHALRNALLPVVTILGTLVASILTGSFVIEKYLRSQEWENILSRVLITVTILSSWEPLFLQHHLNHPSFHCRCDISSA